MVWAFFFATIFFWVGVVWSAPAMEPGGLTLYILLNTVSGSPSSQGSGKCWDDDLKYYIQNKVVGRKGHVYCANYDLSGQSPAEFATEFSKADSGIFSNALENWYAETDVPAIVSYKDRGWNLGRLKALQPDLLPLRFVVLSNGASGLAVREYIQSPRYEGEISNAVFFNTPHEGTGFADQALFSRRPESIGKSWNASSMAALVPLTLSAYVVGGSSGFRDVMLSLAKDAVFGMAAGFASDAWRTLDDAYFSNFNANAVGLWYLTQDADEDDPAYGALLDEAGNLAIQALGSTQLLNSSSKANNFNHPLYNVVYSDGFPTIGNGRRTLADFAEQDKNHVSKEKLKSIIADSLSSALTGALDASDTEELKGQFKELAGRLIEGDLSGKAKELAGEIVERYGDKAAELQNILRDERLSGYLQGLSEIRNLKWNKDDIPGSVLKVLSAVEKFIPEEYKSELYSVFIENFSPETIAAVRKYAPCIIGGGASAVNCAKAGMKAAAEDLASYSLNFFDSGTLDVPAYSAYGGNVEAFKSAATNRFGYALDEIVEGNKGQFQDLYRYQGKLKELGEFEQYRKVIDASLDVGCGVLDHAFPAYGKICRAAEFAVNVGLMAEGFVKVRDVANLSGSIAGTRDVALWAAMREGKTATLHKYGGEEYSVSFSDLDSMLYGRPVVSIASVSKDEGGVSDSIVPLFLTRKCEADIHDFSSLMAACPSADSIPVYRKSMSVGLLKEMDFSSPSGKRVFPVKHVRIEEGADGNLHRRTAYYAHEYFVTDDFLREFRFQIDDASPDSLRLIRLDFSSGVRIAYERGDGGAWNVFFGENLVKTLPKNPVDEWGRFIFRPEDVLSAAGTTLSAAEEDGLNTVNVYVVNKLGLSDSRQFSFFLQAADPLLEEGWPKNYGTVSAMEKAHVYFGNLAYPFEARHGGVKVSKMVEGTLTKLDSIEASVSPGAIGGTFKISANFSGLVDGKWPEGEYLLEWNVSYAYTDGSDGAEHSSKTGVFFFVDTTAPKLKWNVGRRVLTGNTSDGKWGALEGDSSGGMRALRVFALGGGGLGDTIPLYERRDVAGKYFRFGWPDGVKAFGGKIELHAQAFDFSNPSEGMGVALQGGFSDTLSDIWPVVLDEQGQFRAGINGTDVVQEMWVDGIPPRIESGSLSVEMLSPEPEEGFGGKTSKEKFLLNAKDTLKLSFAVREEFPEFWDSTTIRIELSFRDSISGSDKMFAADYVSGNASFLYSFVEPAARRLPDGIYQVAVQLTDEAGNVFSDTLVDRLVVDRTLPVVAGVYSGGVAFSSPDSLKSVTAYVEQKRDIVPNRSDLSCYSRMEVSGISSGWTALDAETESKVTGKEEKISVGFSRLIGEAVLPNGTWTVRFRCYDAAGNAGENIDFFGMGARFPQITSPSDSLNEMFHGDIAIRGIAPNPAIHGGNDNSAEFKIDWKAKVSGEGAWSEAGIVYLASGVHPLERTLALWEIPERASGIYDLRLSVRACRDEALCSWISTVREIPVYNGSVEEGSGKPKINMAHIPENQVPGVPDSISFEFSGTADTAEWTVHVSIQVQSPVDSQKMIPALSRKFNPVTVSPFSGSPASFNRGLSIWRSEDRTWNLHWHGVALGLMDSATGARLKPTLRIKSLRKNLAFNDDSPLPSETDTSANVERISVGGFVVPAYDRVDSWNLSGGDLNIRFVSDSAFTLDLSTVEGGSRLIFCGASNRRPGEISPASYGTAVLYVHPEQYQVRFPFDGLTGTGLYPGGERVNMKIYAYDNRDLGRVLMDSASWLLNLGGSRLVTTMPDSGIFYLSIADTGSADGTALSRQKLGYTFGLVGCSARVSAKIMDSEGSVLRTLMEKEEKLAGSDPQAYALEWDGMTDENFAATRKGFYSLRITAYDDAGKAVSELAYPFELRHAGGLAEAPLADAGGEGVFSELSMDEAVKGGDGLRFVGDPDYLMRVQATAHHLPEGERAFRYKWVWDPNDKGVQFPAMYKKYRPSLGIWRQRDKFDATVAILFVSYAYGLTSYPGCNHEDRAVSYQISLQKVTFDRLRDAIIDFSYGPEGRSVIAYGGGDRVYPMLAAVKVLPIYEYDVLWTKYFNKKSFVSGNIDYHTSEDWDSFWKDSVWSRAYRGTDEAEKPLFDWFNNWENKTVYWEGKAWNGRDYLFDYDTPSAPVVPTLGTGLGGCAASLGDDATGSVCEDDDAKVRSGEYNPHADMLDASVEGRGTYGSFGLEENGNIGFCGNRHGSLKSVTGRVRLKVKDAYWEGVDDAGSVLWGNNNLANRFVRLDPTNKTLFGADGYFYDKADPLNSMENKHNGAEMVNCVAGSKKYPKGEADCYLTAFESLFFGVWNTEDDPILFPDERPSNHLTGDLSLSRFRLNFFNAGDDFLAVALNSGSLLGTLELSENHGHGNPKSLGDGYDLNPFEVSFWVAPKIKVSEALDPSSSPLEAFDYPYLGSEGSFKEEFAGKCRDGFRCYGGFASRIHYGIGDWTEADWQGKYLVNGFIRNNVLALLSDGIPVNVDEPTPQSENAMNLTLLYSVEPTDVNSDGVWSVPRDKLDTLAKFRGMGEAIRGEWIPEIVDTLGNWEISSNCGASGCDIANPGVAADFILEYVRSIDPERIVDRKSVDHDVPFTSVLAQNEQDTLLASPWTRNGKVTGVGLFRRDSTRESHLYLDVDCSQPDSASLENAEFHIRQKNLPFNARVDEMATLRGRIPGNGANWNLLYTKDGMLFPLASGVQDSVPADAPYPVLAYMDMNHFQGNTTFFLTYGGLNGMTFFRQMDVHVGALVKSGVSKEVHSMYGNVSVNFPEGAWGDRDVDVTVRTISLRDYNFTAFDGLDIVGPVVEILPSHVFEDSTKLPEIKLMILKTTMDEKNLDASNLKIYKPNFETGEIMSLETEIAQYFDGNIPVENPVLEKGGENWDRVWLKAKTKSFSTFFVMDSAKAFGVVPRDSFSAAGLVCGEMSGDTLWAGIINGWLEVPYPCSGKSNYLLQLRNASSIAAEHQGVSAAPVVWKARTGDIRGNSISYDSRIVFYGVDGSVAEVRGPVVRIDSSAPVFLNDMDLSVQESGSGRTLEIEIALSDTGSGVAETSFDLYFGGRLVESRTIFADSILVERFDLSREDLYGCVGCMATVSVTTEDFGHNYTKAAVQSDPLYPYPTSLVLWYPLGEGAGILAREMTGSGLDLNLGGVSRPWMDGKRLHLFSRELATSENALPPEEPSPFSVEMKMSVGRNLGAVVGWNGSDAWSVGVDSLRRYYVESAVERITFAAIAEFAVTNHLVFIFDGTQVSLFKNGVLEERRSLSAGLEWSGKGRLVVGKPDENRSASGFTGYLSDIRLYRSALSPGQVLSLYRDGLDLDAEDIVAVRAVDALERDGLAVDQSCGIAGMAFLRQKAPAVSMGTAVWEADVRQGDYALYLKTMNAASEESRVEILVDGVSQGVFLLESTGFWRSERVGDLTLGLSSGIHRVSVRPIGNVGIAALALVNEKKGLNAQQVDYGEQNWKLPSPKISVDMAYGNAGDLAWVRPNLRLGNLTGESIAGARVRYYYAGEGEGVQAFSFYPNSPMRVVPDAGGVFYGELTLSEEIPPHGFAYGGNGPQMGLHRADYYFPWHAADDPSYAPGADSGFVESRGVAVLDADGNLLNDWVCYDAAGPVETVQKSVSAFATDFNSGSSRSSNVAIFVENTGTAAIDGFEVRYYYRRDSAGIEVDLYYSPFAEMSIENAGGDLGFVSFLYKSTILNPGEKSDFGSGVRFELHSPGWTADFNAANDPSHFGLDKSGFRLADSILVLDLTGNLLWGAVPQPDFGTAYQVENAEDLIRVEGNIVYVEVPSDGTYALQTVNAAGVPLSTLFRGSWDEGTHSVDISNGTFAPGSYLVLRQGTRILSWKLFK